jgi:hypothetical protein
MQSPWINGSQGSYAPPAPGLASLLEASTQRTLQGIEDLGTAAGQFGSGVAGAIQGATNPSVFGNGTSAFRGALLGFANNFGSSRAGNGILGDSFGGGGGGGGGSSSGMAGLVNGSRNGPPSVAQLQAAGKTADAFRAQLQTHEAKTDDQESNALGMSDDEWDTLGAAQKQSVVQGFVQGQIQKEVQSRIADFAAQAQERQAQAKAAGVAGDFLKHALTAPPVVTPGADDATDDEGNVVASGTAATTQPPSMLDRFNYAASQMPPGADIGRALPMIMNSLDKMSQIGSSRNGPAVVNVDTEKLPGYGIVTENGSRNFQVIRTGGINETTATDADGNPVPGTLDRNGNFRPLPKSTTPQEYAAMLASVDKQAAPLQKKAMIPGIKLTKDEQDQLDALNTQRQAIYDHMSGKRTSLPGAAAPATPANPKDPLGLNLFK